LQRGPRLNSLLRFLSARQDRDGVFPGLSIHVIERTLRSAHAEVLIDDLSVLQKFCGAETRGQSQQVAKALHLIEFLPARGRFGEFLDATESALARMGWKQHATEIASRSHQWADKVEASFSRSLYLRWLEEIASTFSAGREASGDHPYARVHLLTIAQAQSQEWSHLIFAGMNEGSWPPAERGEFAREEEIQNFNRSIRQLNRRAARQGNQGEGHTSVRDGHTLYLGPSEQRQIAHRQFQALLESATANVALAASLMQEDAPERFWNPSECFTQLYFKTQGKPLTQAALKNLRRETVLLPTIGPSGAAVQQTLIAFNTRRDVSKPAGEYDFALRPNESYRPSPPLSVSDLERMVSSPAIIWMKRYLGLKPPDDTANPWAATSGKWVHCWLASIGETEEGKIFAPFPSSAAIDQRVCMAADERRAVLQALCASLGKSIPDWWNSGWLNARFLARHLGGKIASAEGWSWMTAELPIGNEGAVKIADEVELQLRGQIDLVLAQDDAADFAGQKIWIVDYKTGSTQALRSSDLHDSLVKGTTLQLGLYSLALRELGAAEVSVSILSLAVKNVAPQLTVADLAPHTNVFADLAEMQRSGVFGMKGEVRPAFGYGASYPLATLQIDEDILEDKWALTHENLVLEKEEWEVW
ncbi:MAG: PD-(D/E)XK nuclease family protein, partial [Verrucomicrobiota bacterium]